MADCVARLVWDWMDIAMVLVMMRCIGPFLVQLDKRDIRDRMCSIYRPAVTMIAAGGFVVNWDNQDSDSVMARQYDSTGKPLSNEITVASSQGSVSYYPDVAADANGNFAVTWTSIQDGDSFA